MPLKLVGGLMHRVLRVNGFKVNFFKACCPLVFKFMQLDSKREDRNLQPGLKKDVAANADLYH